jgi:ABC-2 type transport system permease protein
MMFRRTAALMVKEFLALLKDRKSRTVVIFPPIVQLIIFGYAATFDLMHVPYAVYNESPGRSARELLAKFSGSNHFREKARLRHYSQIASLIDRREVLLVIHIGPLFQRNLMTGQPAVVQVIVDGRNSNTALLAFNYVRDIVQRFNQEWSSRYGKRPPSSPLKIRAWFNPNLESRWFFVPGIIGLLTQVVTLLVTALSVAREREQGTFDQLLVTPMKPLEILIGKALPGFLIGTVEATFIILVAVFWFDIPLRGDVLTLYIGILVFLLSAIGVGLMISAFSVTQQQGLMGAFLFMVPAVILSGFATPIDNMPLLIQSITYINPMRYYMVILRGVFLEGTPFALLVNQLWPMAAIGLVTLTVASWLFRRRIY